MDTDSIIQSFMELTQSSESVAKQVLESFNYDLQSAVAAYYSENRETNSPEPRSMPSSSSNKQQKPSSKFKSFRDLREEESAADMDNNDDDETNFFTGGEKSGLQVENPNKKKGSMGLVQDLLKKAEKEGQEPAPERTKPKVPLFKGSGFKLGSVENNVKTQEFRDPNANKKLAPEPVTRKIIFWKEGFQVDDGELHRYDDPANAEHLKALNQGRAPLSLLKVEMFQDVQVDVEQRLTESFVAPKARPGGFSGTGQRLGSPVPGESAIVVEEDTKVKEENAQKMNKKKDEEGEGDAKIQIRLANGKRVVHRFNSSDLVAVVFDFVANNTQDDRRWALAFAFPLQIIEDKTKTIKEAGMVNSVIVQRWV